MGDSDSTQHQASPEPEVSGSWTLNPFMIDDSGMGGNGTWAWYEAQPFFGGGDGSYSKPYLIENITIVGGTNYNDGITIVNSTKYFTLRNCTVQNNPNGAGIKLDNAANGKIMDNNCSSNEIGIHLLSSHNNTIDNNTVFYQDMFAETKGIFLDLSENNTIIRNILDSLYGFVTIALHLLYSDNNTIMLNNISNTEAGFDSQQDYRPYDHNYKNYYYRFYCNGQDDVEALQDPRHIREWSDISNEWNENEFCPIDSGNFPNYYDINEYF